MKSIKIQYIGLITGALMIAASLVSFYVLRLPVESNFQLFVYGIFTAGLVLSLLVYHKTGESKSFKDYFSAGFKTFIIVALLMAIFTYIFFNINTAFRDAKIAENNILIKQQGDHLPNEIEENTRQLKKMFLPIMVSSAVFRYLITGALVTAITAGFLSQKAKNAE